MKTILLTLLAVTASASPFRAEYTFAEGYSATATFNGTRQGNLVTDISDVSVYASGTWLGDGYFEHAPNVFSYTAGGSMLQAGGAVLSFDGSVMNFRFDGLLGRDYWPESSEDSTFAIYVGDSWSLSSLYFYEAGGRDWGFESSRWSLIEMEDEPMVRFAAATSGVSSVPDTGAVGAMVAAAFAVLVSLRRKV